MDDVTEAGGSRDFDTVDQLLEAAKKLEGMRISEVSGLVGALDDTHRSHTKGVVAHVIETEYFGIRQNSSIDPDFKKLGVELKVSPLKLVHSANLINAKERNVIEMMDYLEVARTPEWRENKHLASKLGKVLFVFYLHEKDIPALKWRIVSTFIWSPNRQQQEAIQKDYEVIRSKVLKGEANSERDNTFLATCPKHSGGFNKEEPLRSKPGALCPHPRLGIAQRRAFCIRNRPLIGIVADALEVSVVRNGNTEGIKQSSFPCLADSMTEG